jgi:hypothetical protein
MKAGFINTEYGMLYFIFYILDFEVYFGGWGREKSNCMDRGDVGDCGHLLLVVHFWITGFAGV